MDAGSLGAAEQGSDVMRILERVEDEEERRLGTLGCAGEDIVERGELARLDDQRDALVPVEACECCQGATLDLHDRDAQVRRVQHELLERRPPLRHDQQAARWAAGDEGLLDRSASGDQLLVRFESLRRRQCRPRWTSDRAGSSLERWSRTLIPGHPWPAFTGAVVAGWPVVAGPIVAWAIVALADVAPSPVGRSILARTWRRRSVVPRTWLPRSVVTGTPRTRFAVAVPVAPRTVLPRPFLPRTVVSRAIPSPARSPERRPAARSIVGRSRSVGVI
jgi:hypothetical protein